MTEETRVSLLEANMTEIKGDISDIKTELKALGKQLDNLFNTKVTDHIEIKSQLDMQQKEIDQIQRSSNLWRWLSPTLAAVAGSVITLLVINWLEHLK